MGRSRGGLTTMIHLLADTRGWPLRVIVTTGQVGDIAQAPVLLSGQCCYTVELYAEDRLPARCAPTEIELASSSASFERTTARASQSATTELPFTYQALPCRDDLDAMNTEWS